jgi:hypothetical protein
MVILVFDTHHANNIPTDSPEHGDHHGTVPLGYTGHASSNTSYQPPRYDFFSYTGGLRHSACITRPILDEERPPEGDLGRVPTAINHT